MTDLDGVIVYVQTEADALVEGIHGLLGAVDVRVLLRLHKALLVVNDSLDHAVTDSLHAPWSISQVTILAITTSSLAT